MKAIENDCCGSTPIVWRCECNQTSFCGCDVEKIECFECGRIIWGADDDSIKQWNEGGNDEPDELIK